MQAYVDVLGVIWMPPIKACTTYILSDYDLDNIGEFTRDNVEEWLAKNAGDFQYVIDFSACAGAGFIDWDSEENGLYFTDIYNGDKDD